MVNLNHLTCLVAWQDFSEGNVCCNNGQFFMSLPWKPNMLINSGMIWRGGSNNKELCQPLPNKGYSRLLFCVYCIKMPFQSFFLVYSLPIQQWCSWLRFKVRFLVGPLKSFKWPFHFICLQQHWGPHNANRNEYWAYSLSVKCVGCIELTTLLP